MKSFIGTLIKKERLRRNYSQEGLCRGICVVSYLSKIEQGHADASTEILTALLERLGIHYETDQEFLNRAGEQIQGLYEKLYEGMLDETDLCVLEPEKSRYLSSDYMLDVLLLSDIFQDQREVLKAYVSNMEERQYSLYLFLECRKGRESYEKLLKYSPNGYYLTRAGMDAWEKGAFQEAIELLNRAYTVSSQEGTVQNMLLSKIMLGNCYSSICNQELMLNAYQIALRIARVSKSGEEMQDDVYYNIAATFLEWRKPEEAKEYFQRCRRTDALYYHKYAICEEQLGERQTALAMLEEGRKDTVTLEGSVYQEMYRIVEYRLTHEDYLKDSAYEILLRTGIAHMLEYLPLSYAKFHVPYLIEVLERQRKYKEICEWMKKFS